MEPSGLLIIGVLALICIVFAGGYFTAHWRHKAALSGINDDLLHFVADSVDHLPDGVARFDANEKLVYCNATYREMNEVIADLCVPGTPFETLARGKVERDWAGGDVDPEDYIAERMKIFRGAAREWEEQYEDGTWILARDRPTEDGGRVCLRLDITERKKAEEKIRRMANHDPLTGLPGLRMVQNVLSNAMKRSARHHWKFAVMFIDLDGFKDVNDAWGHGVGDDLLRDAASRMKGCMRETDLVARIGGDEFLVVQDEVKTLQDAIVVAEKIVKVISAPFSLDHETISIGASIGIALYPDHGTTGAAIIAAADKAMYAVKTNGKNGYRFFSENGVSETEYHI